MISMDALWTFSLMVGLLTLTPGLDTALILRTAALGHRLRAWGVVLGIQSGTLIWGVLTSLGVTALLTASSRCSRSSCLPTPRTSPGACS
ncbi:LysE family transporter [Streptomyces tubercidicus]